MPFCQYPAASSHIYIRLNSVESSTISDLETGLMKVFVRCLSESFRELEALISDFS